MILLNVLSENCIDDDRYDGSAVAYALIRQLVFSWAARNVARRIQGREIIRCSMAIQWAREEGDENSLHRKNVMHRRCRETSSIPTCVQSSYIHSPDKRQEMKKFNREQSSTLCFQTPLIYFFDIHSKFILFPDETEQTPEKVSQLFTKSEKKDQKLNSPIILFICFIFIFIEFLSRYKLNLVGSHSELSFLIDFINEFIYFKSLRIWSLNVKILSRTKILNVDNIAGFGVSGYKYAILDPLFGSLQFGLIFNLWPKTSK